MASVSRIRPVLETEAHLVVIGGQLFDSAAADQVSAGVPHEADGHFIMPENRRRQRGTHLALPGGSEGFVINGLAGAIKGLTDDFAGFGVGRGGAENIQDVLNGHGTGDFPTAAPAHPVRHDRDGAQFAPVVGEIRLPEAGTILVVGTYRPGDANLCASQFHDSFGAGGNRFPNVPGEYGGNFWGGNIQGGWHFRVLFAPAKINAAGLLLHSKGQPHRDAYLP